MPTMHCHVSGLVQGVFFRAYTRAEAQRLGLVGWVRNLPDSRVELMAQGDEAALAVFTSALYAGPPASRVEDVSCAEAEPKIDSIPLPKPFEIQF